MPSRQRGFARKRGARWLAGWYEEGRQRTRGGFETKTAALDYANEKADKAVARAAAFRFGDPLPDEDRLAVRDVDALVDAFLVRHRVDEATKRKLRSQLRHARDAFGDRTLESLQPIELDVWRSTLPALSGHYVFRAFRQVLEYAVAMGLLDRNPTARIKNVRASVDTRNDQRRSSRGSRSTGSSPRSTRASRRSPSCLSAPASGPKSCSRSNAATPT